MLTDYAYHMASKVWAGEVVICLIKAFHSFDADVEQVVDLLVELLEVSRQDAKDETEQCRGPYVCLAWLQDIYRSKCDTRQWIIVAQAYVLHLVGCTLFANKSATHISVVFWDAFCDLNQSEGFSWGAIALVHMYDNLMLCPSMPQNILQDISLSCR